MKNRQLAHNWANQSNYGENNTNSEKANNFYYNGNTIYSYGSHFPIATYIQHPENGQIVCLFTTQTNSITTAKHISYARQANWREVIECTYVPDNYNDRHTHCENIDSYADTVKRMLADLDSCTERQIKRKADFVRQLENIAIDIKRYYQFFDSVFFALPEHKKYVETVESLLTTLNEAEYTIFEDINEQYREYEQKRRKDHVAKLGLDADKAIKEFKAGKISAIPGTMRNILGLDYLRYNEDKKRFETSQAVQIPLDIAKRFYTQMQDVLNTSGGCNNCDMAILDYQVREITPDYIQVGCHKIAMTEINEFSNLVK